MSDASSREEERPPPNMWNIELMIYTTTCAWCLKEQGIVPNEEDSHGCCSDHAQQVWNEYLALKATRRS